MPGKITAKRKPKPVARDVRNKAKRRPKVLTRGRKRPSR